MIQQNIWNDIHRSEKILVGFLVYQALKNKRNMSFEIANHNSSINHFAAKLTIKEMLTTLRNSASILPNRFTVLCNCDLVTISSMTCCFLRIAKTIIVDRQQKIYASCYNLLQKQKIA